MTGYFLYNKAKTRGRDPVYYKKQYFQNKAYNEEFKTVK